VEEGVEELQQRELGEQAEVVQTLPIMEIQVLWQQDMEQVGAEVLVPSITTILEQGLMEQQDGY
jgi:hypothetical protein